MPTAKLQAAELKLDEDMKVVDPTTGKAIQVESKPELEANRKAKRRDAFYKAQTEASTEVQSASYVDPRIECVFIVPYWSK